MTPSSPPPQEERQQFNIATRLRDEVTSPHRGASDIREKPSFVQWAGLRLAYLFFGLIAFLLLGTLTYWVVATPRLTAFGDPVTAESLALYQKASDLAFQRITTVLDPVVVKMLLPVLTLILGYIFGSREGRTPPSEGES